VDGAGKLGQALGLAVCQRGQGPAKGVIVVPQPCPDVERLQAGQGFDDGRAALDFGSQTEVAAQFGQVDLSAVGDQDQRCDMPVQQAAAGSDQRQDDKLDVDAAGPEAAALGIGVVQRYEDDLSSDGAADGHSSVSSRAGRRVAPRIDTYVQLLRHPRGVAMRCRPVLSRAWAVRSEKRSCKLRTGLTVIRKEPGLSDTARDQ